MADELIVIEKENAVALFSEDAALEAFFKQFDEKIAEIPKSVATKKERDLIKSTAYQVSRLKTRIDDFGADLVDDMREKVKAVDARRKDIREKMDERRDAVRKPLTDWEEAEEARIAAIQAEIEKARSCGHVKFGATSVEIQAQIDSLPTHEMSFYQEFEDEARPVIETAYNNLVNAKTVALNAEREKEELERQRAEMEAQRAAMEAQRQADEERRAKEDAERQQVEEARIHAENERLRLEAEERAAIELEKAALERQRAEMQAQQEAAEKAATAAREQAERDAQDEIDRQRAEMQREREAFEAEKAAAEQAALEAKEAAEREAAEIKAAAEREAEEARQRILSAELAANLEAAESIAEPVSPEEREVPDASGLKAVFDDVEPVGDIDAPAVSVRGDAWRGAETSEFFFDANFDLVERYCEDESVVIIPREDVESFFMWIGKKVGQMRSEVVVAA